MGKTHLAVALAKEAIGRGYGGYFVRAYDLMEDLRKARADHNLDRRLRVFLAPKVLVVDEFGIWPYNRDAATAFFTLVSARYERGSIIRPRTRASASGTNSWGTRSSPRRSWTGCCTTTMRSTSGARATGCPRNGSPESSARITCSAQPRRTATTTIPTDKVAGH